ncbi:hypothetical protein PUN28_012164 [Cardiocondyla obscurior]|uniref:Uncharacterized protein n=1 Tax=Cardiocondyla obscurior TaxID=286306 RepID=A0AAW2FD73_9HYME
MDRKTFSSLARIVREVAGFSVISRLFKTDTEMCEE